MKTAIVIKRKPKASFETYLQIINEKIRLLGVNINIKILIFLKEKGATKVNDIAIYIKRDHTNCSTILKNMYKVDFVIRKTKKDKRTVYYSVNSEAIEEAIDEISNRCLPTP